MLAAEPSPVELDLVNGPVVPEYQVVTALAQALELLCQRLRLVGALDILGDVERR